MWSVDKCDFRHARCRSVSARRSIPAALYLFTVIFLVRANFGVLSEYMAIFLCLSGASTPYSKIHPKNKAAISKSKIDSVPFGFFCVISDNFTSRIHSCLHTIGSRSSVPPIHIHPQPCPDASINSMYDGYPIISNMHLVGSVAASCISCRIPSTNFLATVYFSRFTHDVSCPSTSFTDVNTPFASGMPIVARRYFPMTEIFFIYSPLRLISFKECNNFYVYLGLLKWNLLIL